MRHFLCLPLDPNLITIRQKLYSQGILAIIEKKTNSDEKQRAYLFGLGCVERHIPVECTPDNAEDDGDEQQAEQDEEQDEPPGDVADGCPGATRTTTQGQCMHAILHASLSASCTNCL